MAGRLFVAVWPPASLVAQLRQLDRPVRPGLRWTTEDQWHVTLRFLGGVDRERVRSLREALGPGGGGALTPWRSGPDRHRGRSGRGVWVLPVEGLEPLAARVGAATCGRGAAGGGAALPGPHHPGPGPATRGPGRTGEPAGSPPGGSVGVAGQWRVADLTLVRSELRADGARYEVVARWPLGGGAG